MISQKLHVDDPCTYMDDPGNMTVFLLDSEEVEDSAVVGLAGIDKDTDELAGEVSADFAESGENDGVSLSGAVGEDEEVVLDVSTEDHGCGLGECDVRVVLYLNTATILQVCRIF